MRALTMTIAVGAVAGLSLSACSSSGSTGGDNGGSKSPTEALAAAVHNLNSGKAESFQLSLKPDDAMLAAMNKDSDPQDAQIAKNLFGNGGIVVKFTASANKPLKDLKAGENPNIELDLTAGGTEFVDIRMVGGALYARADVPQYLQLSGQSVSDLNRRLQNVKPELQPTVQALVAGKWLGASASDVKSLEQLLQNFGNSDLSDSGSAPTSAGTQMLAGIESSLMKALTQDATVTDKGSGQYEVSGKIKVIGQDVLQAISPTLSAVPGGKSKADIDKLRQDLNSVPDSEYITFTVWLKNNQISELQVDLAQFLSSTETGGGHLPVDAKFSQTAGSVNAPGDVTTVDVQKLLSSFGQDQ